MQSLQDAGQATTGAAANGLLKPLGQRSFLPAVGTSQYCKPAHRARAGQRNDLLILQGAVRNYESFGVLIKRHFSGARPHRARVA
jgi:hypothetical protein